MRKFISGINKLCPMPRDTLRTLTIRQKTTEKPTLRKIKRGASQHKANAFAPHLILPQRTQAHPPPKEIFYLIYKFKKSFFDKINFIILYYLCPNENICIFYGSLHFGAFGSAL